MARRLANDGATRRSARTRRVDWAPARDARLVAPPREAAASVATRPRAVDARPPLAARRSRPKPKPRTDATPPRIIVAMAREREDIPRPRRPPPSLSRSRLRRPRACEYLGNVRRTRERVECACARARACVCAHLQRLARRTPRGVITARGRKPTSTNHTPPKAAGAALSVETTLPRTPRLSLLVRLSSHKIPKFARDTYLANIPRPRDEWDTRDCEIPRFKNPDFSRVHFSRDAFVARRSRRIIVCSAVQMQSVSVLHAIPPVVRP